MWVGARELPPEQQSITLLGTPLGTPEFQATHLQATADQHSTLLQRIPAIQDLQAEWLLLLYCASPRCNYLLRMLRPEITQPFAQAHDTAITLALAQLLDMRDLAPTALGIAHLPLHLGGLGLTSASLLSHSAYWASWADTLPILDRQDPTNTATILEHLHRGTAAVPSLQAITEAQQQLQHHGFNPPSWEELAAGRAVPPHLGPDQPLCRSSSPGCQTCERAHVPRTPPNTTLQTCRASHRSWWPLEPGSHNLPTVVGPSKSPNHPSPAQGLIHECLDPPVVCPNHPCSHDRLCGQSPGI